MATSEPPASGRPLLWDDEPALLYEQIDFLRAELDRRATRDQHIRADLASLDTALQAAETRCTSLTDDLAAARAETRRAVGRLDQIRSSRSYRLGRSIARGYGPLRKLRRMVGGLTSTVRASVRRQHSPPGT